MSRKASELVEIAGDDHLETLRRCSGYYNCPKDSSGKRLGPLTGYAGKYLDEFSDEEKQWVGDCYYNFAKAEEYPHVLDWFAELLAAKIQEVLGAVDYVFGAPMGGLAIAKDLSRLLDCRYVFAEKKVTALATAESREQSVVILNRHEIERGLRVVLVEDVCNNFSTTDKLFGLVRDVGAEIVGIACELNRSPLDNWKDYPVAALMHVQVPQYRQDDPQVAEDIAKGNVVWKQKDKKDWQRLMAAMEAAQQV